jgi:putative Ca2+/H+ antiporter (TMEM165/GDT1 family)
VTGSPLAQGLVVFGVIFALEIVDKTNFAVITLSAKHPHFDVWLGASAAFLAATAVSVGIGAAVAAFFTAYLLYVELAGGAAIVGFGVRELREAPETEEERAERRAERALGRREVWLTAFGLVFLLEMGDNTQILAILFVVSLGSVAIVFLATALAMISVAAIGARSGAYLKRRLDPERLARGLGWTLVVVGALTMALSLVAHFDPVLLPRFVA